MSYAGWRALTGASSVVYHTLVSAPARNPGPNRSFQCTRSSHQAVGLVVVGLHAPEFAFEKNLDNVRGMVKDLDVSYPVAVANDHAIWRAFDNNYWPPSISSMPRGKCGTISRARAGARNSGPFPRADRRTAAGRFSRHRRGRPGRRHSGP